jgi:hypothetical protein
VIHLLQQALFVAIVVAVSWLLVLSAVAKAVQPSAFARTLSGIGLPPVVAKRGAVVLAAVEWTLAAAMLLWPASLAARVSVVALFAVFALAAVYVLLAGREVRCSCFGALHGAQLGRRQILQLPVVATALLLVPSRSLEWTTSESVGALALVQVAVAGTLLQRGTSPWRLVRAQRRSLAAAARGVAQ